MTPNSLRGEPDSPSACLVCLRVKCLLTQNHNYYRGRGSTSEGMFHSRREPSGTSLHLATHLASPLNPSRVVGISKYCHFRSVAQRGVRNILISDSSIAKQMKMSTKMDTHLYCPAITSKDPQQARANNQQARDSIMAAESNSS